MEEIKETLIRIEERLKNDDARIVRLEAERADISKMATQLATMTALQNQMMTKVDSLNAKVDELEKRPAKRWDSLVAAVISAIVGIAVGFFLKG